MAAYRQNLLFTQLTLCILRPKCTQYFLDIDLSQWYHRTKEMKGGNHMKLGSNLQYLRKLHGNMTQEKLAERMSVSRQTISKWETGVSQS